VAEPLAQDRLVIGMPVYNGEKYVRGALDSLLSQSYRSFTVLISDNGSTDATEQTCREYAARDPRVVYVRHDQNRGVAFNFSFVLKHSRSEFFMWAADDDRWDPHFVASCVSVLEAEPRVGLVTSNGELVFHSEAGPVPARKYVVLPSMTDRVAKNIFIRILDFNVNAVYGMFRRVALEGIGDLEWFDLCDVFIVNAVSMRWKIFVLSDFAFKAGTRQDPNESQRKGAGARVHYGPFLRRSVGMLLRELPWYEAMPLVAALATRIGAHGVARLAEQRLHGRS
jgi:glycosyltransferase involved in cell wall biosynthesis